MIATNRGRWAVVVPALVALMGGPARGAETVEFNRDVRPILSENCYFCHGPDKTHRESGVRLDVREAAIEKGAIVPGNPDESELVARVLSDDRSEVMPPPKSTKRLTAAQKETLRRWVEQGAEYQPHWAYVAPRRPDVPPVSGREWVRNPVDAFILAALESRHLRPSPEAGKRALLRRVSLDLTGLPPTPEEVRAFLDDPDPKAYERQVARLLDSPHYGERMAVPWLDLARFADTVGYHGDQNQNNFPYRDYVIAAFNRNMPFDRFTTEQLAGDLLPDPSPDQLVATGFNRLNMMTREGGAQPREYLAKYAADRVRTVSTTWLGSTMGCCECHDHKFDPFTARDFYRLGSFFSDVKQWGVYAEYSYTPNPDLRGYNNDYPFPPEIEVASPYLGRRRDRFQAQIRQVFASTSPPPAALEAWRERARDFLKRSPDGWIVPPVDAGDEAVQPDGSVLLTGMARKGDEHQFILKPAPGWVAAIRLELIPHEAHKGSILRTGAESSLIQLSASRGKAPLPFSEADADLKDPRYASGSPLIGVKAGWKTSGRDRRSRQTAVWVLETPIELKEGDVLTVSVKSAEVGCVRLALSPFGCEDPRHPEIGPALARALDDAPESRTTEEAGLLHGSYLLGTGWDAEALARYRSLRQGVLECRDGRAFTAVTQAWAPPPARVLPRGNWQDESGEAVEPGVPGFLPQPPAPPSGRLTRLDLARWLTAPENPLTARVLVNRLWKQFFGTAISAVVDDVGAQGEWPVHPELLDWLAVEFRESGWDVKHLVGLIVTSAAYRQDARPRPEAIEVDPNNRLVASQAPRRLEAEFVRDNALAIAGLLNPDVGGPSAFPYQPADYYENLQFPDRRYVADRDDRQYRRGVYTHWQRTFLHPMLANFDAPSREECTAARTIANTPQQALTLLNDPTFVEAARVLAGRLLSSTDATTDEARIDLLYQRALARPARPGETRSLISFLAGQRQAARSDPGAAEKLEHVGNAPAPAGADAPDTAAWTNVCRVVLNLHETITRY